MSECPVTELPPAKAWVLVVGRAVMQDLASGHPALTIAVAQISRLESCRAMILFGPSEAGYLRPIQCYEKLVIHEHDATHPAWRELAADPLPVAVVGWQQSFDHRTFPAQWRNAALVAAGLVEEELQQLQDWNGATACSEAPILVLSIEQFCDAVGRAAALAETETLTFRGSVGASSPTPPPPMPDEAEDNVQFTTYSPKTIARERTGKLLAFAHLVEAAPGEPDPRVVVGQMAQDLLEGRRRDYHQGAGDAMQGIRRNTRLTFAPHVNGLEFDTPHRDFVWAGTVHPEVFTFRVASGFTADQATGYLHVLIEGVLLIARIRVAVRITAANSAPSAAADEADANVASPLRKIFISYSHRDKRVIERVEKAGAALTGGRLEYIRDVRALAGLRSGDNYQNELKRLIGVADVFQLFWSKNSMRSKYVRMEWEHALSLCRPHFIAPVYWGPKLATAPGLPPDELDALQFTRIPVPGPPAWLWPAIIVVVTAVAVVLLGWGWK